MKISFPKTIMTRANNFVENTITAHGILLYGEDINNSQS